MVYGVGEPLGFAQEPKATASEMSPLLGTRGQGKERVPEAGRGESLGAAWRGEEAFCQGSRTGRSERSGRFLEG